MQCTLSVLSTTYFGTYIKYNKFSCGKTFTFVRNNYTTNLLKWKTVWQYDSLTVWHIGMWYIGTVVWQPELLTITEQNYISCDYFNLKVNRWEFQLSLFVPGIKKATLRATYILFKVFFMVFARLFHGQTLFHLTNKSITKFVLLWWLLSPTSPYTPTQTEKKTLHLSSVVIANIYEEMGQGIQGWTK